MLPSRGEQDGDLQPERDESLGKREPTATRTSTPEPKRPRQKGQGKGRRKHQDARMTEDVENQTADQLIRLVAKLTLQHEDQHSLNKLDTTFHLWLRNSGKEALLQTMHGVSQRWKNLKDADPTKLEGSLRATLFSCLMVELKQRLMKVRDQPGMSPCATWDGPTPRTDGFSKDGTKPATPFSKTKVGRP